MQDRSTEGGEAEAVGGLGEPLKGGKWEDRSACVNKSIVTPHGV